MLLEETEHTRVSRIISSLSSSQLLSLYLFYTCQVIHPKKTLKDSKQGDVLEEQERSIRTVLFDTGADHTRLEREKLLLEPNLPGWFSFF